MASTDLSGSSTDVSQDELMLPGFISAKPGGVFVDLRALALTTSGFELFVERLFTGGMRFSGLDYAVFLKLLYDAEWLAATQGKCPEAKIATGIVRFASQRQALYRAVKLLEGGKRAEYVFEPVSIGETCQEPIYGEPGEDGVPQITGYASNTRQVPSKLDFDEFVSDMWLKGVKFGIDADAVRQAITSGTSCRITIARHLEPTAGRDAAILEVYSGLHRDNSPRIMLSGKADLRAYKNRFPQIAKGKRMLKKVPRVLGRQGYQVTGEIIEPKMPKDVDMYAMASVGTTVEQAADGEYIVSILDGFIMLDTQSNSISVTEKIETTGGISVRTTGDLELGVDEFIEHGEVQEGREVKGKHMTFRSDVFGSVLAQDGNIHIEGNLAGGRAESLGGNITLCGRTSRAVVRACDGEVDAHCCEHSTVIGRVVRIEHAVNCEIVAEELYAGLIEGCTVAARKIRIACAGERRGKETLVAALVPDLAESHQRIAALKQAITEARESIKDKVQNIEALKDDPEFAKFALLQKKIRSGAVRLTAEQVASFRQLAGKHATATSQLAKFEEECAALELSVRESEEQLANATREQDEMGADISCVIDKITGHAIGRTIKSVSGSDIFNNMSGAAIRVALHKMDSSKVRIFSQDSGAVSWKFEK